MDEEKLVRVLDVDENTFSTVDYVLFGGLLLISAGIGIFYAIKDRRRHTTKDFLLAGGNMHVIPVALSLLASFMSAITILGTPWEMYNYGTMYWWIGLSYVFAVFLSAHIYIPVFYRLGITSSYEYLEHRFGKAARTAGAAVYILQMTIYMACVLYAPSLALNAVTGFSLWGSIWAVGLVCTFYTSIGGMKAVLWTDTFQTTMMVIGLLAVLIQGSIEIGGFGNAWNMALNNSRIDFLDFSPDPRVRHSAWSLAVGGTFLWTFVYGVNQAQVQRAVTCPTLKKAQIAYWLNCPGLAIILYLTCLIGIVIYGYYMECDPKSVGRITAGDQILPLFVMDVLGHLPGIPGLFIACMFSGALSTISSGLNSISAVILTDFIRKYCFTDLSERVATIVSKFLALFMGLVAIGLTYVASLLGGILEAALALYGILGGPLLGTFTLGMIFPWTNQIGAISGIVSSLSFMVWISAGYQINKPKVATPAPISIEGCKWKYINATDMTTISQTAATMLYNTTTVSPVVDPESNPLMPLYSLSYMWYTATAVATCVIVGLIVSFITGPTKPEEIDPRFMAPFFDILFPYLPEKILKPLRFGVRYDKMGEGDVTKRDSSKEFDTNPHLRESSSNNLDGLKQEKPPAYEGEGQMNGEPEVKFSLGKTVLDEETGVTNPGMSHAHAGTESTRL